MSAPFDLSMPGSTRRQNALVETYEALDPAELADFLDAAIEEDWCEGCGLPVEACCCPEPHPQAEFVGEFAEND